MKTETYNKIAAIFAIIDAVLLCIILMWLLMPYWYSVLCIGFICGITYFVGGAIYRCVVEL